MKKTSLRDLYIDELRDLYSAETQLVKALPKIAKASSNEQLREAFQEHLQQTEGHVSRLEQIFDQLEEKASGKKCLGMEGLIKEGSEAIEEDFPDEVKDAGIIGAAQRVEHYEIAAYGTAREFAKLLGEDEHVSLLEGLSVDADARVASVAKGRLEGVGDGTRNLRPKGDPTSSHRPTLPRDLMVPSSR